MVNFMIKLRNGLTLLETVISLAILGFSLMIFLLLATQLIHKADINKERFKANFLAQKEMELLQLKNFKGLAITAELITKETDAFIIETEVKHDINIYIKNIIVRVFSKERPAKDLIELMALKVDDR